MTNQPQLDALIGYIQQHRQSADRAAIRQRLLQDGADPQLVEQALAQVYGAEPAAQPIAPDSQAADQPDSVERITAYLEQHRQTYTQEALRQKLLADGHEPQAVDLAAAQVYGFAVRPSGKPEVSDRRTVVLTALGLFVLNYVVWMALGLISFNVAPIEILWLIPTLVVLEIAAAVAARTRSRAVARGLAWGIAISMLPVVALALFFGICLAIIYSSY
ncbi:MAG TPA: hypothetical protein VFZ66_28715 [Herpetosiphonaceae bacterium]